MSGIDTSQLGLSAAVRIDTEILDTLNLSFTPGSGVVLTAGQAVKINSDGTLGIIASGKDYAGIVIVGVQKNGKVTIRTPFHTVVVGYAKNAITAGQLLIESGADTVTNGIPTYDVAATGNYAIGRALQSAAQGAPVRVGLLSAPIVE